jgi:hypothetical protein
MGASAREIEQQIKDTRKRIDENLTVLENRAASGAVRFAKIAAIGIAAAAAAVVGLMIYRSVRRPKPREQIEGPGPVERIMKKVVPTIVGTASTVLLERVVRSAGRSGARHRAPRAD